MVMQDGNKKLGILDFIKIILKSKKTKKEKKDDKDLNKKIKKT
jgi:hypothetical protein